ncbi:helix-turn-helix domain-containing protein [Paenibacillus sp. 1P07SE]|uniref:helix-turn-helix domain-containing protein n=1 Tax=Paenibacillus sp. 1P07SE TaxID=3132209 RepID=UPI0039A444E4
MSHAIRRAAYIMSDLQRLRYTRHEALRPFRTTGHAMLFLYEGSGKLTIHDRKHTLRPGSCCLLAPGTWVKGVAGRSGASLYVLQYEAGAEASSGSLSSRQSAADEEMEEDTAVVLTHTPAVVTLLSQMEQLGEQSSDAAYFRSQSLFYELLHLISLAPAPQDKPAHDAVRMTVDYMDSHYMNDLQVGTLPEMANLTPSAYCRAFKKSVGCSPGTYLTKLRIRKAKELLRVTSRSTLKEIAQSVGYSDELYFSRVFKKSEGVSPTVYASSRSTRVAVVSHLFLQDHLLSLGIQPVAAPAFPSVYAGSSGFPRYLQRQLQGTRPLNAESQIELGDVQRLEPDVIIKMAFQGNPSDSSWIRAENAICLEGFPEWYNYVEALGSLLHKEAEAESVIRRVEQIESSYRSKLQHVAAEVGELLIVRALPGDFRIYGSQGHALTGLFYRVFGFQPDPRASHAFYKRDTWETLLQWDPASLLFIWSDPAELQRLRQCPEWQQLRAVREGRVYFPDTSEWDPWGPSGREYTIYDSARYFQQAVPQRVVR